MTTRRQQTQAGVTLLEIIVAMALLGLIAAGTFGAFVVGRRVMANTDLRADALRAAQQTVEELRLAIRLPDYHHPQYQSPNYDLRLDDEGTRTHPLPGDHRLGSTARRTYAVDHGTFRPDGSIDWAIGSKDDHDMTKVTVSVTYETRDAT